MSRASGKSQPTTRADALLRLRDAREFHEVAASVRAETPKSAISLFVQAGIASSDAICGMALGEYWRGDAHAGAIRLIGEVSPDGKALAKSLGTLLTIKDAAQYSTRVFSASEAVRAERASWTLLAAGEKRAAQ